MHRITQYLHVEPDFILSNIQEEREGYDKVKLNFLREIRVEVIQVQKIKANKI